MFGSLDFDELANFGLVGLLKGHRGGVNACGFSLDGVDLISCGEDGRLVTWRPKDGVDVKSVQYLSSGVSCSACSRDGRYRVSACYDGSLHIWDTTTNQVVQRASVEGDDSITGVDFTLDGRFILSCSGCKTQVWQTLEGEILCEEEHENDIYCVATSPKDARTFATASSDGKVKVWSISAISKTMKVTNVINGHAAAVLSLAWSPDGRFIATGCENNEVKVWLAATATPMKSLGNKSQPCKVLSWCPASRYIAAGLLDRISIYEALSNKPPENLYGHEGVITAIAWSPDGRSIASGGRDTTVRVWERSKAQKTTMDREVTLERPSQDSNEGMSEAEIELNAHYQMLLDQEESEREEKRLLLTQETHDENSPNNDVAEDESIVIKGPDGEGEEGGTSAPGIEMAARYKICTKDLDLLESVELELARKNSYDGLIPTFHEEEDTGSPLPNISVRTSGFDVRLKAREMKYTLRHHVTQVKISKQGRILVCVREKQAYVWMKPSSEKASFVLLGHHENVTCGAWSSNGLQLILGSADTTATIWDIEERGGSQLKRLKGHTADILCVDWNQTSKQWICATGSLDTTILLWDAVTGKNIDFLRGHTFYVRTLSFSADGSTLASGSSDNSVITWDVEHGIQHQQLTVPSSVMSLAWAPAGDTIATGCRDGTVVIWDPLSNKRIATFTGHESEVWDCNFSPNGKFLVTVSWDRFVRVWSLVSNELVFSSSLHSAGIKSCAWVEGDAGEYVVTGSLDRTVQVWDVEMSKITAEDRMSPKSQSPQRGYNTFRNNNVVRSTRWLSLLLTQLNEIVDILKRTCRVIQDIAGATYGDKGLQTLNLAAISVSSKAWECIDSSIGQIKWLADKVGNVESPRSPTTSLDIEAVLSSLDEVCAELDKRESPNFKEAHDELLELRQELYSSIAADESGLASDI